MTSKTSLATFVILLLSLIGRSSEAEERSSRGLLALYTFQEGKGRSIRDRSGVGTPLDLEIERPGKVRWKKDAITFTGKTRIFSSRLPHKILKAVKNTGEITIEAWITPKNTTQQGPARIVTLSQNSSARDVTVGQDGNKFDVRLRTTKTSENGIPSLASGNKTAQARLTHLVYTRTKAGIATIYLNGKKSSSKKIAGSLDNWNESYRFLIGGEWSADRGWLGDVHFVALFSYALSTKQILQNFKAGPKVTVSIKDPKASKKVEKVTPKESVEKVTPKEEFTLHQPSSPEFFKEKIVPLLTKHCFKCHHEKKAKGKIDLTQKALVFPGPDPDAPLLTPKKPEKSLLYEVVLIDEMPKGNPPLTQREKLLLQKWIAAGAVWPTEKIDYEAIAPKKDSGELILRRLTVEEYIDTVEALFNIDVEEEARKLLPPDLRADGFSNTAYNLTVDLQHIEAYQGLAEHIVDKIDLQEIGLKYSSCENLSLDCIEDIVSELALRIFRSPLQTEELESYQKIAALIADEGGSFDEGLYYVLYAMLQSPRFIYRAENQLGDGKAKRVTSFELATRMSYLIWGGPPDEKLLQAARSNSLQTDKEIESQVKRMLQDPRAKKQASRFVKEWLDLDRLSVLRPNKKHFPHWSKELAQDMRRETIAFFEEVAWKENQALSTLLNAKKTFLTPRLAKHYGIQPQSKKFALYDLSNNPARGGILTQGSVLTMGGDEASMVTRGLFVLKDLLGSKVGDPPPELDTTPVPSKKGMSRRDVAQTRVVNPSCGGCHAKFEPLAFAFEKYDGVGGFSESDEHGNTLREDGVIEIPGDKKEHEYKTTQQLNDLLAANAQVQRTIEKKMIQFALGRPLTENDTEDLKQIHNEAKADGSSYRAVIQALVKSNLIRMTQTEVKS